MLEFIIPTYNNTSSLMCMISSLTAQTNPNWKAHVVADCPPKNTLDKIIEYFKEDSRIKFTELDKRYNDFGDTPRAYGLQNSEAEFVIMTGDDNYYVPTFVNEFINVIEKDTNFVYCNMVLDHVKKIYVPVKTKIELGFIDTGCYASRTEMAKEIGVELKYNKYADWVFADKFTKKFGGVKHIDKILYVHN
jgi:glycosyltransferase involved in cell wall biosynthesis